MCALFVNMTETTQGSKKNVYSYKLQRRKLAKPVVRFENTDKEYVIEYGSTIKSVQSPLIVN